jgi:glutamate N-acetyltransferase/amino-acid N-acetyltransferase
MAELTASLLGAAPQRILVASTGVIGNPLPMAKVREGIRAAVNGLSPMRAAGADFTRAILTTDRFPKEAEVSLGIGGRHVLLSGVAKGAGMIEPNMATMLSFLTTDARVSRPLLQKLLARAVDQSFNRITVDGHMSTNDTCVLLASGASGATIRSGTADEARFAAALDKLTLALALEIVRDGEGAVRVAEVRVNGARSNADAELAARAIAHSPLVKTALFGSDPNWGRIVSAAGACGCAFIEDKTSLRINSRAIYTLGKPRKASKAILNAMKHDRVTFELDLGLGRGSAVVYTCDLGHNYVHLNADYHT